MNPDFDLVDDLPFDPDDDLPFDPVDDLPNELYYTIFRFFKPKELLLCSQLDENFNSLCKLESLWKPFDNFIKRPNINYNKWRYNAKLKERLIQERIDYMNCSPFIDTTRIHYNLYRKTYISKKNKKRNNEIVDLRMNMQRKFMNSTGVRRLNSTHIYGIEIVVSREIETKYQNYKYMKNHYEAAMIYLENRNYIKNNTIKKLH